MRNLAQKPLLLAGIALVQVMTCQAAFAQTANQQATSAEDMAIVVTGSRIAKGGFQAPTPTTVVDEKALQAAPQASIAAYLNLLPTALLKRVDIVTGGASAAWGSDAVAGVVNLVLDTDYNSIKGQAQAGISTYGDAPEYKAELSGGPSSPMGAGISSSADPTPASGVSTAWIRAPDIMA